MRNYFEPPQWRRYLTLTRFKAMMCVLIVATAGWLGWLTAVGELQQIATHTAAAAVHVVLKHKYQLYPYPKRAEPI